MNDEAAEKAVLKFLQNDGQNDDDATGTFHSLTTLFEKVMKPSIPIDGGYEEDNEIDTKEEFRALLNSMVEDGLVESRMGERDYEQSYKLTEEGHYEASGFDQLVLEEQNNTVSQPPLSVDSEKWTGPRRIVIDQKIIAQAKHQAKQLRKIVYEFDAGDNATVNDLRALVDVLISVLEMCEPELSILDRILASPKFRLTASIFAAAATVRGALGI